MTEEEPSAWRALGWLDWIRASMAAALDVEDEAPRWIVASWLELCDDAIKDLEKKLREYEGR